MKMQAEIVQMGWRYHIQLKALGHTFYSQLSYSVRKDAEDVLKALKDGGTVE